MSKLKKWVKDFLYSRHSPEFLSAGYFVRKDANNRARLDWFLREQVDLMEAIKERERPHWVERIDLVLSSEDNQFIPRHAQAGEIEAGGLILHNGIRIDPLSYYSFPMLKMLIDNKGVHEPQEEKIFQEVLKAMAGKHERPTMLELGAYWSFYSMWFLSEFPQANCFMVEPNRKNLFYGKQNFKRNGMTGTFVQGGIGKAVQKAANITTVDAICQQNNIQFLDILHSDIQGFELEMLEGSKRMLDQNKVGYAFISTHSNELHHDCRDFLKAYNFVEIASANVDESYSWDGILVMCAPGYEGLDSVEIAKRKKTTA